jgi:hypothetical protein
MLTLTNLNVLEGKNRDGLTECTVLGYSAYSPYVLHRVYSVYTMY